MNPQPMNPGPNDQPQAAGGRPQTLSDRVKSLRLPDRGAVPARRSWLPWVLCVLFGFSTLALAFRPQGTSSDKKGGGPPDQAQAAGREDIALESKGYILPIHKLQISPYVTAKVKELLIEEGQIVEEDEEMAILDDTEYRAEVKKTRGQVTAAQHRIRELKEFRHVEIEQARLEMEEIKAQMTRLEKEKERTEKLIATSAAAQRDWEQAHYEWDAMEKRMKRMEKAWQLMKFGPRDERIKTLEGELQQAQGEADRAQWRLDNCVVRAPTMPPQRNVAGIFREVIHRITGIDAGKARFVVLTKTAELAGLVNPSAFSSGVPASICELANLRELEVDVAIAERDVSKVFKGQQCKVAAEAFPKRFYEGRVSRIMPIADRSKGAVPVRVEILFPDRETGGEYLRPEMGAIVTFLKKK